MRRSVLLLSTVSALAALAAPALAAPVRVDFEEEPTGTALTTRYAALGLTDFGQDDALAEASGSGCSPVQASDATVLAADGTRIVPPSAPNWGAAVAAPGGGAMTALCARFAARQSTVTLRSAYPATAWVLQGGVARGPTPVPAGTVTLGSPGAPLSGFKLEGAVSQPVRIDDLDFDGRPPAPQLTLLPDTGSPLRVRAGSSATRTLRVRHRYGDTRAGTLAVTGDALPAGVSASVTPTSVPADGEDHLVTLEVRATAAAVPVDVVPAVRLTPSGGPAVTQTVRTRVVEGLRLAVGGVATADGAVPTGSTSAPVCRTGPLPLQLSVVPSDSPPLGPVAVEIEPLDVPQGGGTARRLEPVAPEGGAVSLAPVVSYGPLPNFPDKDAPPRLVVRATPVGEPAGARAAVVRLDPVPTTLESVTELDAGSPGALRASIPRWKQPGALVRLTGKGICPGSVVFVGASFPVPLTSLNAEHTEATFRLREDMTPSRPGYGPLNVPPAEPLELRGPLDSVTKAFDFQLPRASSQFELLNVGVPGGVSWQHWTEVFGGLTLGQDVCKGLKLGLRCPTLVTDPAQYDAWQKLYSGLGSTGLCFGHVMASDWLERGRLARAPLASFKPATDNFEMTQNGKSQALQDELERRQIAQASPVFADLLGAGWSPTYDGLAARLGKVMEARQDAWLWIGLAGKGAHIVRVTRVDSSGAMKLAVLDSNAPFTAAEAASADTHRARTAVATITVSKAATGDGYTFSVPSLGWSGKPDSKGSGLWVIDPREVPQTLPSPLQPQASASSTTGASTTGAVELLGPSGKPLPGAMPMPLPGGLGQDGPALLRTPGRGPVTARAVARDGRPVGVSLSRAGVLAAVRAAPGAGRDLRLGLDGGEAVLPAGRGGARELTVTSGRGTVSLTVPATVGLRAGSGSRAGAAAGSRPATVTVTRGTGRVAVTLRRGGAAPVALRGVRLRAGERLRVPGSAPRSGRVRATVTRAGRRRTVRLRRAAAPRLVRRLTVAASRTGLRVRLATRGLDAAGTALVAYGVRRRGRRVARGTRVATAAERAAGRLDVRVARTLRRGDRVTVAGVVRTGDGATTARQRRTRVR